MDIRRLILFIALSLGLMFAWEKYFAPAPTPTTNSTQANSTASGTSVANSSTNNVADNGFSFAADKVINVTTDLMHVQISTVGGDIRNIDLLKYTDYEDTSKPYQLLLNQNGRVFVAQTGLISADANLQLPTHKTIFKAENTSYTLSPDQKTLAVNLTATTESGAVVVVVLLVSPLLPFSRPVKTPGKKKRKKERKRRINKKLIPRTLTHLHI